MGGLWSGGAFALPRQTRGGFCQGGSYVLHSIDSLAFLPCDQVLEGMEYLPAVCPEEIVDLLTYFNTNYVSGSFKKLQVPAAIGDDRVLLRMRKVPPPLFSVDICIICF